MGFLARVAALLGFSAYQRREPLLAAPENAEQIREAMGGQIQPPPTTQTRWYLADLEAAIHSADQGQLGSAAKLMRSARGDGVLAGVLSTRTAGLVRLPKRFHGPPEQVKELERGKDRSRSIFDEMFPAGELALLAADGELLGVGVGELVPVQGRDFPIFVRLDPEYLVYMWNENRWYFRSLAGMEPITPGDGRWVLHCPGGRVAPWQHGLWKAIGRAYIRKEHAALYRDNWEAKLANPARVAVAPQGGTEAQKEGFFQRVMAWGVNTVFGLTPGYDVKLIESNGRGADSFVKTIAEQNQEFIIAVAGQTVTTDGGAGFQNSDIHRTIRADLIKASADALAYTINTQGLPPWIYQLWGEAGLEDASSVEWDVTPPKDREKEALALLGAANAIGRLDQVLAAHGRAIDLETVASQFGIPLVREEETEEAKPVLSLVSGDDGEDASATDTGEDVEADVEDEAA